MPEGPAPATTRNFTRHKHAFVALMSALMALVVLTVVAFHGYIAWMVAYPYVAPLTSNPKLAKNLDYTDVTFPSMSGRTTVGGWYIPASKAGSGTKQSERTIVFSHGYGANREETWVPMYDLANLLHKLHYNVLMFDYGYASAKYKAPATGGYEESQQLLAAVKYARDHGSKEVVVWGFSMGAGTALQAALQTNQIDALVLDSLFLPSPDSLFENVRQIIDLPRFPSLPMIEKLLPLWTGVDFNKIPASSVQSTSYDIPIFIMHGTKDAKASYATAEAIASKQTNPLSREWIVNGGSHELLFREHPKEYIQRAALFLSQVNQSLDADNS
ncbi:alpha/beta hydrolase [Paenibacillus beijingensis]|uniref:Alpha/beta hydrolase n=1 Tax=Paenibacillus beijingensis TaxID=1126833 RepID=A0A0D5NQM7_9BACL|nr:alpha/beta hydrolase [Paenibacillus beijingensis]